MAKIKANGGNFYIDNVTLKQDKKIIYVAEDLHGNLTDEGVEHKLNEYAKAKDGTHTGTTHIESAVVDGELNADSIIANTIKQGNTDLLHEIQNLEVSVRELKQTNGNDICFVHMYSVYMADDAVGIQSSMSVEQLQPYIYKNKLIIGHNSDNHTITPMFVYHYDTDSNRKITAIYWYQQDVEYNKMLMYKQTGTDVVEFQSNGK